MEIKFGKIVKTTNVELYDYWLDNWSDFYDYTDFRRHVIELGTIVTDSFGVPYKN